MDFFTVVYHHGGTLVHGPPFKYEGGEIHPVKGLDPDRWSYFEALSILRDLGYGVGGSMWWFPGGTHGPIKEIKTEKDALDVADYALKNMTEVDIYIEHNLLAVPDEVFLISSVDDIMNKLSQRSSDEVEVIDVEDPVAEIFEDPVTEIAEDQVADLDETEIAEEQVADTVTENVEEQVAAEDPVPSTVEEHVAVEEQVADTVTESVEEHVAVEEQVADPLTENVADPLSQNVEEHVAGLGDSNTSGSDDSEDSDYNVLKDTHEDTDGDEDTNGVDDGFDNGLIPEGVHITYADAPPTQDTPPSQVRKKRSAASVNGSQTRRQSARLRRLREPRILSTMTKQQSNAVGAGGGSNGTQSDATTGAGNGNQAVPDVGAAVTDAAAVPDAAGVTDAAAAVPNAAPAVPDVNQAVPAAAVPQAQETEPPAKKGSSSRPPAHHDEYKTVEKQVPEANVTIAQLVAEYMSMMDTWKKEAKKKGINIRSEDKNKGGDKKGGKK
ncbi:hypothetical protein RIF29_04627 [Crotalaria pallida]|uniref:PB1-like domain-containing protein n=1 Tax=Crotalaria pallida TaxID=3830 RepID=A0AAN9J2L4_CROPI